jgi:hypothetical protein
MKYKVEKMCELCKGKGRREIAARYCDLKDPPKDERPKWRRILFPIANKWYFEEGTCFICDGTGIESDIYRVEVLDE